MKYCGVEKKGLHICLLHIKGHQDDAEFFQNLTRWAQLNVMADHKSKQRLSEFIIQGSEVK